MKDVAYGVFLLGTLALFQWVADVYGFSQEHRLIGAIIWGAFVILIPIFNQLNALEKRVGQSHFVSDKWIEKLYSGKPITPVHEPSIPAHVSDFPYIDEFFDLSENFADRVNRWLAYEEPSIDWYQKPWRLQQLASTYLNDMRGQHDRPYTGREYQIWFKGQSLGKLQLSPNFPDKVTADIKINHPRVFSLESIWGLVGTIGSELHCNAEQLEKARHEIMFSALSAVWQVGPRATHNPDLVFSLQGQLQDPRLVTGPEA